MPLKLYMDHHVPRSITVGLRQRGVDVLTALEDGTHTIDDPALLDRATALDRVLFSRDDDLLTEATRRLRAGVPFGGVIYAHQQTVSIGQAIRDLELITMVGTSEDVENHVIFLPL